MEITKLLPIDAKDALTFLEKVAQETDFLTFDASTLDKDLKKAADFYEFLQNPDNGVIIKCVSGGIIIGIADVQRSLKDRLKHNGEVSISILKQHWGSGASKEMVFFITDWAKKHGLKRLFLIVRTDNTRAIAFYKKHGYQIEGKSIKSIYVKGCYFDEYTMALYI